MNFRDIFSFNKKKEVNKRSSVNVNYIATKANKYASITNPDLALTNSVIYRGISILTDSVATIPLDIYHKNKQGYWELDEKNPLHSILTRKSNKRQTIYELLEGTVMQMMIYGNAYIYINRDIKGDIKELILLYPNTVYNDVIQNKYTITDTYNGINGTFNANQIIHIKHKSLENIVGKSIVEFAAKTLGLANACDSESLATLNSGGKFKGIVSSESSLVGFGEVIDDQIQTIRDNMLSEINSGNDIITLNSGVNFQPISQTMKDLQIAENKQFTLSDIARFMGISLSKLYIAMGSNYQAAANEQLNFYIDTLNPLLTKIEKAFNTALISESVGNKYKIEFNRMTLPYYKDVLMTYEKLIQLGVMSTNDIRKIHNQKPIDGGDKVLISTNLQFIDNPTVFSEPLGEPKSDTVESEENKEGVE